MDKLHLAVITDGSRRYSAGHNKDIDYGYNIASGKCRDMFEWAMNRDDISTLSVYALSINNFEKRSPEELKTLFRLLCDAFSKRDESKDADIFKNVRFRILSLIDERFPKEVQNILSHVNSQFSDNKQYKLTVNLLFGYDGQTELAYASKNMALDTSMGLGTRNIRNYLLVKDDVDILVRTGNEQRISGFLPFQAAQAQLYFETKMFPECNKSDFTKWIDWYYSCTRRFGK